MLERSGILGMEAYDSMRMHHHHNHNRPRAMLVPQRRERERRDLLWKLKAPWTLASLCAQCWSKTEWRICKPVVGSCLIVIRMMSGWKR